MSEQITTPTYANIWDWMERTGTTQTELSALTQIRRPFLCKILSRGRRCSLANALKLSAVTRVPVEKLFDKPKRVRRAQSEQAFRKTA